ncbi:hypothetical protein PND79_21795 [Flavonifractor plautii]|nr:hypothetical protein [Flavonifractor plautii]MDB7913279.1 hypothetical protein [Flavonifractor plautii]MDB7917558.1 hypothetical protein [Flavonifractor plautii]
MTAIVCVDEAWGMAFHGRRQSRDRAVCARIGRVKIFSHFSLQALA